MRTWKTAKRGTLAAAILALATVATGAVASDVQIELDSLDPGMMSALERDIGMTPTQFQQQLQAERQADTIIKFAERRFGDNFAGGWIERDSAGNPKVVVATTGDTRGVHIRGAEVRQAKHSLRELDEIVENFDAVAASSDSGEMDGLYSWGVDLPSNSVVVTVAPHLDVATHAADFAIASDAPTGALSFEVSKQAPSTLINIVGGIRYNGCSVGFPVTRGNTKGFVTAGHCGNVGAVVRFGNTAVGNFQRSNFPGADAAWANVRSSDTLTNRVSRYDGSTYAVTGSRAANIGATVCRSGFRTGWRCGTITRNNVSVNYGTGTVSGLRESNACAGQGDSGGSWVASANQAQGVTSGGALGNDGTNCGIAQSQRRTWFQPLIPMLNSYGLTLVTR